MARKTWQTLLWLKQMGGGGGLTFLLRDDFTTAASAPLTSPRTAEPGPGQLKITDTTNNLSISSGALQVIGNINADPGLWSVDIYARAPGLTVMTKWFAASLGACYISAWDTNQASAPAFGIRFTATAIHAWEGSSSLDLGVVAATTTYTTASMLRSLGQFILIKGGAFTNWTLLWVGVTDNTASLYANISQNSPALTASIDTARVLQLPAPYTDDYGLATQRLAGARAAADAFVHEADCVIEWTQTTVAASGSTQMKFRIQDATNFWDVVIPAGGNIVLREVVAGSATNRGSASSVVANGHRIVVVCDGTTIRGYSNNVLRWTYSSASNFATETDGELTLLGTGGAVSDIVSWPRVLTSTAAALLDAAVA